MASVANVASASREISRDSPSLGGLVGVVEHVRCPTCSMLSATMRGDSETMRVPHVKAGRHLPVRLHPATRSSTSCYPIHKQIDKQNCVLTIKIAKPNLTNSLERHVGLRAKPHAALQAHGALKSDAASSKPLNPCEETLSILTVSVCFGCVEVGCSTEGVHSCRSKLRRVRIRTAYNVDRNAHCCHSKTTIF